MARYIQIHMHVCECMIRDVCEHMCHVYMCRWHMNTCCVLYECMHVEAVCLWYTEPQGAPCHTYRLLVLFYRDQVSCSPHWLCTYYIAQDDLEPLTLLYLPPECWDRKRGAPHFVYVVLGLEPGALYAVGQALSHLSTP